MFEISVFDDYETLSERVAQQFARQILKEPESTLGLATGETPKLFYRKLIEFYEQGLLDFSRITTFNLDEFYPMSTDHPKRFAAYMDRHLYDYVNVDEEETHVPDSTAENPQREAGQYEEKIYASGGIDLQLLGIGENGHIGFNEPGSDWNSRTRVVALDEETVERYSSEGANVPNRAITIGIRTIMHADRIILMASGERKAEIVERVVKGPVAKEVPASILQVHPDLQVCLDRPASTELKKQDLRFLEHNS